MIEARSPGWVIVVVGMVIRGSIWGAIYGGLTGALLGLPIFGIGAIFGLIVGCVTGILAGALSGLILGMSTLLFFYPLDKKRSIRNYRIFVRLSCAVTSIVFTFLMISWVVKLRPESDTIVFIYYRVIPLFLALLISQWICPRVIGWYIEAQKT